MTQATPVHDQQRMELRIKAAPVIKAGLDSGLGWEDIVAALQERGIDFKDGGRYVRERVLGATR